MILNLLYFIINTVLAFAGSKPRCGKQVRGAAFPCHLIYLGVFGAPEYRAIVDFSRYEEEGIVELQVYDPSPPPVVLYPRNFFTGEEENVILRQEENGEWTWS